MQGHYYCSSCDYRLTPEEYHQANARRGPGKGLICAIAAVAVLVLFLSLGAPNQPGSVLIGLIILMNYLGIDDLLPVAILCD